MACWVIAHCSHPLASNGGEERGGGQQAKERDNEREVSQEGAEGGERWDEKGKLQGGFSFAIVYVKYQVRFPF